MLGSRLWGTQHAKSDWDVLVVLRGDVPLREIKARGVDALVMGDKVFEQRLQEHRLKELCCLWAPADNVLRRSRRCSFRLDLACLLQQGLHDAEENWKRCQKYLSRAGDRESANMGRKTACVVLRELELRLQIARHSRVQDFAASLPLHQELQGLYGAALEWTCFEAEYGPRMEALTAELSMACAGTGASAAFVEAPLDGAAGAT